MAQEIKVFPVTIPAGTALATPQVTQLAMAARVVDRVEVVVPPGPRGEVGFTLGSSGVQVIPPDLGVWIVTDNEIIGWPLEGFWDSGSWELRAYNTGHYDHRLTVRFLVRSPSSGAPVGQEPIAAGALSGGGLELPPIPPVDLPPLPPPPVLPPLGLPPEPVLPPLGLPPDVPGAAGPAPQPSYNWWYDAMGRLLTWPDQASTTRFDEVFLEPDGSVAWYAWQGGAGQWESYNQAASNQGGKFTQVSACFTAYQGVYRLNIVGTRADGTRALKVLDAGNFRLIQDWVNAPAAQSRELTVTQAAQASS